MRWSELKRRVEGNFAPAVKGRVEVFTTSYRQALDGAGEGWITIDGARVSSLSETAFRKSLLTTAQQLREERVHADPTQTTSFFLADGEAKEIAHGQGVYADEDFKRALFSSLTLSVDAMLASKDVLLHALAMLDRRFDKRRLETFDPRREAQLTRRLYVFRCAAEGLAHHAAIFGDGKKAAEE
jgi:hypothetical protein